MSREVPLQDKLKELINFLAKKYRFNHIELEESERDYLIDRKEVDIAVFLKGGFPFLFVETKRKVERAGGRIARELFHPLGVGVIGQVLSYVTLYHKTYGIHPPFFATANPDKIAVFDSPQNPLEFIDIEMAKTLPVIDVKKLSNEQLSLLSSMFNRLETEYREMGGVPTKENVEKLKPLIYELDIVIAKILNLNEKMLRKLKDFLNFD